MSSVVKLLDYIMGTAAPLHAGRRFIVTGAGGALGSAFVKKLTEEGATVDTLKYGRDYARDGEDLERFAFHDKYPKLDMLLGDCDVLVLCHGVKSDNMEECVRGNCTSQLALIERYLRCHEAARKPNNVMYPEVRAARSSTLTHHATPNPTDLCSRPRPFAAYYRPSFCAHAGLVRRLRGRVPSAHPVRDCLLWQVKAADDAARGRIHAAA
eukprot:scaffold113090_cov37-Tisochrysis_lutea.AAC.1